MAVPETPIDKNNRVVFRKDNIWFTWITFIVLSIAKPFREQEFSDNFFRLGTRTHNSGHIETASFRLMIIGHCANHPHRYPNTEEDVLRLPLRVLVEQHSLLAGIARPLYRKTQSCLGMFVAERLREHSMRGL